MSLSQPLRILAVTGTGDASLTARIILPISSGVLISAEPSPLFAILGAGHPILMSIISGLYAITLGTISAIISGSLPKI